MSDQFFYSLAERGYGVATFSGYPDFAKFLGALGATFAVNEIKIISDKKRMLFSSEEMSLHTDHPDAKIVSWYCVSQSDMGGESLLLDGIELVSRLSPSQRLELGEVEVRVPLGVTKDVRTVKLFSPEGINYAQWLIARESGIPDSLEIFETLLSLAVPIRISLRPGDALFVNNKRMLHGRSKIYEESSKRLLIRHWVA